MGPPDPPSQPSGPCTTVSGKTNDDCNGFGHCVDSVVDAYGTPGMCFRDIQ